MTAASSSSTLNNQENAKFKPAIQYPSLREAAENIMLEEEIKQGYAKSVLRS